jgi:hypothetical protein
MSLMRFMLLFYNIFFNNYSNVSTSDTMYDLASSSGNQTSNTCNKLKKINKYFSFKAV